MRLNPIPDLRLGKKDPVSQLEGGHPLAHPPVQGPKRNAIPLHDIVTGQKGNTSSGSFVFEILHGGGPLEF